MKKILFAICIILSAFSCGHNKQDGVYVVLDSMKTMTVTERGKSFSDHVTTYMQEGDTASARILQDSTMAWINTLKYTEKTELATAIASEYQELNKRAVPQQ